MPRYSFRTSYRGIKPLLQPPFIRSNCVFTQSGPSGPASAVRPHSTQEIFSIRDASSTSFAVTLFPASCVLSRTTTRL